MTTKLGDFIDQAWNDHATNLAGVAARLDDARPLLEQEPAKAGEFTQLAEHLLLGHLGDADAMERWFVRLAPLAERQPEAKPALDRARLAARLLRGGAAEPGELAVGAVVRAHGTAVNGLAARADLAGARRLLQSAAALARDGGADAVTGLAATYNNLASQLLDGRRDRDADALMIDAAQLSRSTWAQVGTWLHAERAEYLLALCFAAIGNGTDAVGHAKACLEMCEANNADAFERFFGREALGRALLVAGDCTSAARALEEMRALMGGIADEGKRSHAQGALDQLAAAVDPA